MDSGLSIGFGPCHLAVGLDFKSAVGQFETEMNQSSRNLRLSRQNVHSRLAEIKKDSFRFASIGQVEFHGNLHGHAIGAAPFAIQQSTDRAQAGPGAFLGEWLIEHEVRAAAQNIAGLDALCDQGHGYRSGSGIQPASFLEDLGGSLRALVVKRERVETMLLKPSHGTRKIAETLHRNPRGRMHPAQDVGRGIIRRNQQCQKGHNWNPRLGNETMATEARRVELLWSPLPSLPRPPSNSRPPCWIRQ